MSRNKKLGQTVWVKVDGKLVPAKVVRIWENYYTVSVGNNLYDIPRK